MLLALLALVQTAAPPVIPATQASDGRCMAAFAVLAADKDKETSDAGVKGMMFFGGRLQGRDANVDFTAALKTASTGLEQILAAETLRCSAVFEQFGKAMDAVSNAPD